MDDIVSYSEEEIERLLSNKLVEGFLLMEKACPACATPLVKCEIGSHRLLPKTSASTNGERPVEPIPGVPFCVMCDAHVVTEADEVLQLERADHTKVRGSILVAMSRDTLDDETLRSAIESMTVEDGARPGSRASSHSSKNGSKQDPPRSSRNGDASMGESFTLSLYNKDGTKKHFDIKSVEDEHQSVADDPSNGDKPRNQMDRVERLLNMDFEVETDDCDTSMEEIEVIHVASSTDCSEVERQIKEQEQGPSVAERIVLVQSDVSSRITNFLFRSPSNVVSQSVAPNEMVPGSATMNSQKPDVAESVNAASVKSKATAHALQDPVGIGTGGSVQRAPVVEKAPMNDTEESVASNSVNRTKSLIESSSESEAKDQAEALVTAASKNPSVLSIVASNQSATESVTNSKAQIAHPSVLSIVASKQSATESVTNSKAQIVPNVMSYTERRSLAARIIGKKMAQGYNLTEQQCIMCQMPLLEKDRVHYCVVCPVIRHRMEKGSARSKGESTALSSKKKIVIEEAMSRVAARATGSESQLETQALPVERVSAARSDTNASDDKKSVTSKQFEVVTSSAPQLPFETTEVTCGNGEAPAQTNDEQENHSSPGIFASAKKKPDEESDKSSHAQRTRLSQALANTSIPVAKDPSMKNEDDKLSHVSSISESIATRSSLKAKKLSSKTSQKRRAAARISGDKAEQSKRSVNTENLQGSAPPTSPCMEFPSSFFPTDGVESPCSRAAQSFINPFADLELASLSPPSKAKQKKLEEEAARLRGEAEHAETLQKRALEDEEAKIIKAIAKEKEKIQSETKRLEQLEHLRQSQVTTASDLSSRKQKQFRDEAKQLNREIEAAEKSRKEAEAEARRLSDERRAMKEAQLISNLELEAAHKQQEAELAMEKAMRAINLVSEARKKILAETIAEGEASAVAEVESIVRSQAEDYHEQKIHPTASDIRREHWETLRVEGKAIMTRRVMAGWTVLPELCRGKECDGIPLLLDGSVRQCVVCGGTGSGLDGVYALPLDDVEDDNDDSSASTLVDPPKEIRTPRLNIQSLSKGLSNDRSVGGFSQKSQKRLVPNLKENFESKRDMVTKEIGKRMMKGWNLLDASCPYCVMPLMTDLDRSREICVLCGVVGDVAEEMGNKSIQTWTKGDKTSTVSRHSSAKQVPRIGSRGQQRMETSKLSSDESKKMKRDMVKELVLAETKKATEKLKQALKDQATAQQAEKVPKADPIERSDSNSARSPPTSPFSWIMGKNLWGVRESGAKAEDPPATPATHATRKSRAIDADASECATPLVTMQESKQEPDNIIHETGSNVVTLQESKKEPDNNIHETGRTNNSRVVTLELPEDFDINNDVSLKELILAAREGSKQPSKNLDVDVHDEIGVTNRHPMNKPSPGMTEAPMPGLLSPTFNKRSVGNEISSSGVPPTNLRLASPGSTGKDAPTSQRKPYNDDEVRGATARPRGASEGSHHDFDNVLESRNESSSKRGTKSVPHPRMPDTDSVSHRSAQSNASRPRVTPESVVRPRSASQSRAMDRTDRSGPRSTASHTKSPPYPPKTLPRTPSNVSKQSTGRFDAPILVQGEPEFEVRNSGFDKLVVVPGHDNHEIPADLPSSIAMFHPEVREKVLIEGGPLDGQPEFEDHRKDGQSVGSATLDAVLARIEETKAQLQRGAGKSIASSAKPQKLRKLIDNLAAAAEEIEKQDRLDMSICF